MEVLRRIMCLCYSNILLQPPIPVSLPCFSSSATSALVARWRGSGGLGRSGVREQERGGDNAVLVLSLWKLKGGKLRKLDVVEALDVV